MKTTSKFFFVLLSVLFIGFTSCDDDSGSKPTNAKAIAGTYNGSLTKLGLTLADSVDIKIEEYKSDSVKLILDKQTIATYEIDSIICTAKVMVSGNGYSISGNTMATGNAVDSSETDSIPVTIDGTIDSVWVATINIDVPQPVGKIVFKGKKK